MGFWASVHLDIRLQKFMLFFIRLIFRAIIRLTVHFINGIGSINLNFYTTFGTFNDFHIMQINHETT